MAFKGLYRIQRSQAPCVECSEMWWFGMCPRLTCLFEVNNSIIFIV